MLYCLISHELGELPKHVRFFKGRGIRINLLQNRTIPTILCSICVNIKFNALKWSIRCSCAESIRRPAPEDVGPQAGWTRLKLVPRSPYILSRRALDRRPKGWLMFPACIKIRKVRGLIYMYVCNMLPSYYSMIH